MQHNLIALFDMDGTLFDYEGSLKTELSKLRGPNETEFDFNFNNNPEYIQNRINLITKTESFWADMPKFELGWDVFNLIQQGLGEYKIHILTQGPRKNPAAWSGKKKCIDKHFGEDFDITLTRDKGLVYGKVLVDDFPGYIEKWIRWRKNGQVIMPANKYNQDFKHPQVIRYDGSNLDEVYNVLLKIKKNTLNK